VSGAEPFDDMTVIAVIAVVDAAARWLDEPVGDEYAYALLGAGRTRRRRPGRTARLTADLGGLQLTTSN
jgi:hypothetical protein